VYSLREGGSSGDVAGRAKAGGCDGSVVGRVANSGDYSHGGGIAGTGKGMLQDKYMFLSLVAMCMPMRARSLLASIARLAQRMSSLVAVAIGCGWTHTLSQTILAQDGAALEERWLAGNVLESCCWMPASLVAQPATPEVGETGRRGQLDRAHIVLIHGLVEFSCVRLTFVNILETHLRIWLNVRGHIVTGV
jgi:hypothetical protein